MSDKTHREKLTELGGWDNELVSVNAGAVKEIIIDLEGAKEEITKLKQERDDCKKALVTERNLSDIQRSLERIMINR